MTDQPPVYVQPQPQAFSKDMNYEQLAVWLTNHSQFVGADHQEDISKLKGMYSIEYAVWPSLINIYTHQQMPELVELHF